jgi:hypothetical protein
MAREFSMPDAPNRRSIPRIYDTELSTLLQMDFKYLHWLSESTSEHAFAILEGLQAGPTLLKMYKSFRRRKHSRLLTENAVVASKNLSGFKPQAAAGRTSYDLKGQLEPVSGFSEEEIGEK